MIELISLFKRYGNRAAVNEVSFKVESGETLVLLGTSGCGKTTTLKMINHLISPDQGKVLIKGKEINNQNADQWRRKIGYVMQNIGLFPHYTIEENIAVVPRLLKWDKKKTTARILELMQKLHLQESILHQFPRELSGGQQQRIGLARALAADPEILLMDEPFGALDNVTRTSIQQEFKHLDELKKKTIVMVTHDVIEAFELADRICLMDKGKIMQIGTPKELLLNPANEFAKDFLAGQHLALTLKQIRVEDLWLKLSNLPLHAGSEDHNLSTTCSIWDAMEQFRFHEVLYFKSPSGELKSVGLQELMGALNLYQSHNHD